MPIPEQYSDIVSRTLDASIAGRVRWKEAASGIEFFVVFKKFSLVVWSGTAPESEGSAEFVGVGIRNDEGNIVDSFAISAYEPNYGTLAELYAVARRSARRIDKAIAEMTSELESEGEIGEEVEPQADTDEMPF